MVKKIICLAMAVLIVNNVYSMKQLSTFAHYCDTNPVIRTITAASVAALLAANGDYCEGSTAALAMLNINATYDLASLYFKKYAPAVANEKKFASCLALAFDAAVCIQQYGSALYNVAAYEIEEYQKLLQEYRDKRAQVACIENERQMIAEQLRILQNTREFVRCQGVLDTLSEANPLARICAKFCTDNCGGHSDGVLVNTHEHRVGAWKVYGFCDGPIKSLVNIDVEYLKRCGQYCVENCNPLCTSNCRY